MDYEDIFRRRTRKSRYDQWVNNYMPRIALFYDVSEHCNGSWTIHTENYGLIDYYPKSDKLLIRSGNKWKDDGMKFLKQKLSWK